MNNVEEVKSLKVVLLCHFTNQEVRDHLPLNPKFKHEDFAPWISRMIKSFELVKDVEFHIIAPHRRLIPFISEFELNGIFYHFFNPHVLAITRGQKYLRRLEGWTKYIQNKLLVNHFLKKINPDIVNLIGSENPYYSATALSIKNIPVFVCIQGMASDPASITEHEVPDKSQVKLERKVHKTFKYFGISSPKFEELIRRDNENPILLKQKYHLDYNISVNLKVEKEYDFVYFGRVNFAKGVDKIIEAIAYLRTNGRITTLNIIGGYSPVVFAKLNMFIKNNQLSEQIHFVGNLPSMQNVYEEVLKSRVSVLSTKSDNIPQTIFESILLDIPVVATNIGGIPYLNKEGTTLLLSEYGDIKGLAENMLLLLDNPTYGNELVNRCKNFLLKEYDPQKITDQYLKQYKAIIANYWNRENIESELLFNRNDFSNS